MNNDLKNLLNQLEKRMKGESNMKLVIYDEDGRAIETLENLEGVLLVADYDDARQVVGINVNNSFLSWCAVKLMALATDQVSKSEVSAQTIKLDRNNRPVD